ncbi:hypothetical protein GCM10020255_003860 [Rhodococcus baikonurensis]
MTELGELTAAQREEAMRRYAVLEPHLTGGVPLARAARGAQIPNAPPGAGSPATATADSSASPTQPEPRPDPTSIPT